MADHSHHHGHSHGHSHGHGHGHHGHSHAPASGHDRAFAIGIALNLGFVVTEAAFGFIADSVALLAGCGAQSVRCAGAGGRVGRSRAGAAGSDRSASLYGLKGTTILAALTNALLLLAALGAIVLACGAAHGGAGAGRGRHRRHRRRDRHRGERRRPLCCSCVVARTISTSVAPSSRYGGRRCGVGGGGHCRARHPVDGRAVDRSDRQHRHRRADLLADLGPAARDRSRCRSARCRGRSITTRCACRCVRLPGVAAGPSRPYLADEQRPRRC